MANRKNIAVYMPQIYSEYISGLRKSIEAAAKRKGYRLIFFTCFGDNSSIDIEEATNERYDEGERAIFRMPNFEWIDGVILLYDAFARSQYGEIREMIHNRCRCPVVNFRTPLEGACNIYVDDRNGFAEMIQHFIDVHHCTRIDLATGPKVNVHSEYRLEIYRKVLQNNKIPYEEGRVHYGNFWKNCGDNIVQEIMDSDLEWPEAIVCANDYMAMSVISALGSRNILVPSQIRVSGYDDLEESRYNRPSLTTVRQPMRKMGAKAIEILEQAWAGEQPEQEVFLMEELVCRQSCGCRSEDRDFSIAYTSLLNDKLGKMTYLENTATAMVTKISNATDMKECLNSLKFYALRDTGFKSFALCLADRWEQQLALPDADYGSSDCMVTMVMGLHNGKILERERFTVCQLLPEAFADDESVFIVPLHYMQYYMGYAVFQLEYDVPDSINIKSWFMHLDNALENMRMRDRLKQVVAELEDLYVRDTLTGLYNRRGLEKYGDDFYQQCIQNQSNFMIMEVDMDGLKQVNDQYGHDEGDICISMIANGLIYAAREGDEVCIRSGGDEYIVLGKDYTQEKLLAFTKKFDQFIENANTSLGKPYTFGASIGYFMGIPDGVKTVENYLKVADDRMYANKKKRKAISHPGIEVR